LRAITTEQTSFSTGEPELDLFRYVFRRLNANNRLVEESYNSPESQPRLTAENKLGPTELQERVSRELGGAVCGIDANR